MATIVDWSELKQRHDNWTRGDSLWPVVPWEEFVPVAEDMIAAEAEYHRAMDETRTHLDRLVPPEERYVAWEAYAPEPIVAISSLFRDAPNSLHPSDFRFNLTYGKSKRAPLEHMRRVAERYRIYARKVRRTLKKNLPAADTRCPAATGRSITTDQQDEVAGRTTAC